MKENTTPSSGGRKSHLTFVILVIVMIIFGLWMYIVLEKAIADVTDIGQQIKVQNLLKQKQGNKNKLSPTTIETSAF